MFPLQNLTEQRGNSATAWSQVFLSWEEPIAAVCQATREEPMETVTSSVPASFHTPDRQTETQPEWTGCFSQRGLQLRDSAVTVILLSRRDASSISADAAHGANKVLIHGYWPCPSAWRALQKLGWPGCGQRARGGCNSTVNRWHTPFLSLLFPQSLHPGATGSPESAPD